MRKPIMSRTMVVTQYVALCIDVQTEETFDNAGELPRTYKTPEKLLKAVKATVETDRVKVCFIKSSNVAKKLYAMPEQIFLDNAKEITGRSAAEVAVLFDADIEDVEPSTETAE